MPSRRSVKPFRPTIHTTRLPPGCARHNCLRAVSARIQLDAAAKCRETEMKYRMMVGINAETDTRRACIVDLTDQAEALP